MVFSTHSFFTHKDECIQTSKRAYRQNNGHNCGLTSELPTFTTIKFNVTVDAGLFVNQNVTTHATVQIWSIQTRLIL
jgi:hypothetical protein